jgi:hypothetical protein
MLLQAGASAIDLSPELLNLTLQLVALPIRSPESALELREPLA